MSKQSSIEWLVTELNQMIDYIPMNKWDAIADIIQQAKQMHKEVVELSDEEIDNAVVKEYENVGDEKLFPNFTDKDIWQNGFYEGAKWYREQLKNITNQYNTK